MPASKTRTGSGIVLLIIDVMSSVTNGWLTLNICDHALAEMPVVPVA